MGPKVIGSIPEGEQKTHKYTCFARSALCIGDSDLYALLKIMSIISSTMSNLRSKDIGEAAPTSDRASREPADDVAEEAKLGLRCLIVSLSLVG